jgi:DNA-binding protein H-NS
MDLSNLTVADLRNLQDKIKQELKNRERQEIVKAREQILAIAQKAGFSVNELIGKGVRAKTGTIAVQYRNPDDATQQWTGRGRQPKWVREWLATGKSLDSTRL